MSTVGVGIVGSGYMALTYAEALARYVQGAKLVAIGGGRRAPSLAADYQVATEPSVENLLSRADVEAVIITSPDQVHAPQAIQAASAGKHVLVEKPMAPTAAQCTQMISACHDAGVKLSVVKTERFRNLTMRAKAAIEEGRIGRIWMLRTVSSFPVAIGKEILASRPFYLDPAGGGLFMSMASHNADMLLWLNGAPAQEVFARVNTYSDIAAPAQSCMAQITFTNGVMADMLISSELPSPGLPSSEVRSQVIGSQGMLDFENYEFLDLGSGDRWERLYTPARFNWAQEPKSPLRLEPHIRVVQQFIDSIIEDRPPAVTGEDGRAAVEICQACLLSAHQGSPIKLPLV